MSNIAKEEFRRVGVLVTNWKKPLLITHARPDGDALGCLIAMDAILRSQNVEPLAVSFDPIPKQYRGVVSHTPPSIFGTDIQPGDLDQIDGVLIMDTCTYNQLEPLAPWLRDAKCAKVALDHHVTRDSLANEYLVDERASAACAIVYDWAIACGWPLDPRAAQALFVGIATDTGWFRFSNCNAHTLDIAADLVRRGVIPHTLYERIFETETVERLRLFGAALQDMKLYEQNRLAILPLSKTLFARTGTGPDDTENLINQAMRIESVQVSVLLADLGDQRIKVSFRSKGGVDVARLANEFGGGGHSRAAGVRISGSLEQIEQTIRERISRELQK